METTEHPQSGSYPHDLRDDGSGRELWGVGPEREQPHIPAGTVVDPGSQLLYIVDTGINISAAVEAGQFTEAQVAAQNVNGLLGITGAGGEVQTNFISITNTHPTKAVTIHFRYFNGNYSGSTTMMLPANQE